MNAAEQPGVTRLSKSCSCRAAVARLVIVSSLLKGTTRSAAAADPVALTVVDENQKSHLLSPDDIGKLPRQQVAAKDRDGNEHIYEGPILAEVLKSVGVVLGPELRGARLKLYVTVTAADDYRVVYSLAELDPTNSESVFLLADRRDGEPLGNEEGPFRIVVPKEKRRARWVRQVNSIIIAKTTAGAE
jgi:hypothetical protein